MFTVRRYEGGIWKRVYREGLWRIEGGAELGVRVAVVYSGSGRGGTLFLRSDAAATIFFRCSVLCGYYSRVAFICLESP